MEVLYALKKKIHIYIYFLLLLGTVFCKMLNRSGFTAVIAFCIPPDFSLCGVCECFKDLFARAV